MLDQDQVRGGVLLLGDLNAASVMGGRLEQELPEEFLLVSEMLVSLRWDHFEAHLSSVAFELDPLTGKTEPLCPTTGNFCPVVDPRILGLWSLFELVQVSPSLVESGARLTASSLDRLVLLEENAGRVVRPVPARIVHSQDLQS